MQLSLPFIDIIIFAIIAIFLVYRLKSILGQNSEGNENNNKFVYVKAIRIKEVCLNCHGSNINDDLKKEIQKLYPDDKAINYKLNDIRGAFVMYRNIKD